jgi:hypothetical protein
VGTIDLGVSQAEGEESRVGDQKRIGEKVQKY